MECAFMLKRTGCAKGRKNIRTELQNTEFTENGSGHKRTGRHCTGGAEKICPENNFFV